MNFKFSLNDRQWCQSTINHCPKNLTVEDAIMLVWLSSAKFDKDQSAALVAEMMASPRHELGVICA